MAFDAVCRVEKDRAESDVEEDVLAAVSSSDAKLKPRLTMIEQQVCLVALAPMNVLPIWFSHVACAEFAGSEAKKRQGCQRCVTQVQDVGA